MSPQKLLIAEDETEIRSAMRRFFTKSGYEVAEADSCASAEQAFRDAHPDAVVLDYSLPDGDGVTLLRALKAIDPTVPLVILTAHGSIDLAVRAVKEGAEQFLTKPIELSTLHVILERLVENRRNRDVRLAAESRGASRVFDPLFGESPAIKKLAERARRVLGSSSPILIHGETGSGKGLLAGWIHRNGPRAEEPFVDLNCAGLSREFLESELFGHERGSFTGAVAAKRGLLEIAHRGDLFLDEIGDLPADVQPKLLKVLEEQRFRRIGEVRDRQVDVRLVAASHHDLVHLSEERKFRSDLYYRLSTLPLEIPPLRERGHDAILIARLLLERLAVDLARPGVKLTPSAESALLAYRWPGNVRELRNVLERAVLVSPAEQIGGDVLFETPGAAPHGAGASSMTLAQAEARHIEAVIAEQRGNVLAAAKILDVSRSTLYEKLKRYGIEVRKPD
jgi:DNA-binding NtrC family response regulator